MVELVKVTGCKDPHRWYADYVGMTFVRLKDFMSPAGTSEWKVRTLDGTSNFIQTCDGHIVESLPLVTGPENKTKDPDMEKIYHECKVFSQVLKNYLNSNYNYNAGSEGQTAAISALNALESELDGVLGVIRAKVDIP
jgi:hypothetical protein